MSRNFRPMSRVGVSAMGAALVVGALVGGAVKASAAESKTYVVGWFSEATYSQDNDCPGGPNPDITKQYLKDLADLGYTADQIEEMAKTEDDDGGGQTAGKVRGLMTSRARIDGKPANPYAYPAFVKDPQLKAMSGKYAYGFNLDGKGASSANGFEDPETHEKGVNNEFARALGCMPAFRGSLAGRPTYFAWAFGQLKDSQPAWLVTVSGDSLAKDGNVTVTFDRALEHLRSNVDGSPRADATYRVDSDQRSHNVAHGTLKGDTITIDQSFDFHMMQNPLIAPLVFELSRAQLRLKMKPDGSLSGIIGGYLAWSDFYLGLGVQGPGTEVCIAGDIPGIYYLLKKHADADPDPKTGENTSISAAYYLEAVPAFVAATGKAQRVSGQ